MTQPSWIATLISSIKTQFQKSSVSKTVPKPTGNHSNSTIDAFNSFEQKLTPVNRERNPKMSVFNRFRKKKKSVTFFSSISSCVLPIEDIDWFNRSETTSRLFSTNQQATDLLSRRVEKETTKEEKRQQDDRVQTHVTSSYKKERKKEKENEKSEQRTANDRMNQRRGEKKASYLLPILCSSCRPPAVPVAARVPGGSSGLFISGPRRSLCS